MSRGGPEAGGTYRESAGKEITKEIEQQEKLTFKHVRRER